MEDGSVLKAVFLYHTLSQACLEAEPQDVFCLVIDLLHPDAFPL